MQAKDEIVCTVLSAGSESHCLCAFGEGRSTGGNYKQVLCPRVSKTFKTVFGTFVRKRPFLNETQEIH
jgi:hypothetical protein